MLMITFIFLTSGIYDIKIICYYLIRGTFEGPCQISLSVPCGDWYSIVLIVKVSI